MVEVFDETSTIDPDRLARLEAAVDALVHLHEDGERTLTLVLVGDEEMRRRNLRDRGIDDVTDVLSYPTFEPDDVGMPRIEHLGDLFVCLPQATRQAHAHGHDLFTEVATLSAHGCMHLLGHDHPDAASWTPFLEAQAWIVTWLAQRDDR